MGGHWNFPKSQTEKGKTGQDKLQQLTDSQHATDPQTALTALFRILVRVVPTVILPITLPGEGLAQSVVTLELIDRAVTPSWEAQGETGSVLWLL